MSEEKTYIGQGQEINGKYGPFIALTLFQKDIERLVELARTTGRPVRININRRKEPSPKGYTHYGVVDKWSPPERQEHPDYDVAQDRMQPPAGDRSGGFGDDLMDDEDLPF